jgi:hypothetical protein
VLASGVKAGGGGDSLLGPLVSALSVYAVYELLLSNALLTLSIYELIVTLLSTVLLSLLTYLSTSQKIASVGEIQIYPSHPVPFCRSAA